MDSASSTVFQDRLLTCLDCGGEFIFTAGEQLFFHDKQFKNDPKRCKPCKSRRAGASAKPGSGPAAAGISRTETRTECSECGIETTVPFKPTQGRPVLCRQCFQVKAAKPAPAMELPVVTPSPFMDPTVSALTQVSVSAEGLSLSQDAAVQAAASMSTALPHSSVATAADLASISGAAPTSAAPVAATGGLTDSASLADSAIQTLEALEAPQA